jgi:hypothetical protein
MRTLAAVPVVLASLPLVAHAQQADVIPFDRLFPPASQQAMGLHRLTDAERELLRQHVQGLVLSAVVAKSWTIQNRPPVQQSVQSVGPAQPARPVATQSSLWMMLTNITIVESTNGSPGYGYLLINTDDGERAHAKYAGNR